MARRQGSGKRSKPKTVLRLPDLEQSKTAVLNSLPAASSQESYGHAIDEFIAWYCSEPRLSFNRTVVLRYRIHLESRNLAAGTINVRLAAVRRLAYEAADAGLLSPELAAGIRRVKGVKKLGARLGNWLSVNEAHALWQSPEPATLKGKRDRAIIAVLLGCGLRRRELALAAPRSMQEMWWPGVRAHGQAAIVLWRQLPAGHASVPFQWTARCPLIAAALREDDIAQAAGQAKSPAHR